jgi:hypothetical protein
MKDLYEIEKIIDQHLDDAKEKIMNEIIPDSVQKYKGECNFPIEYAGKKWGNTPERTDGFSGPRVTDPYILHTYRWDMGQFEDPSQYFEVDLRDAVKSVIDCLQLGENGPILKRDRWKLEAVSAALRDLAGRLDAALERK